MKKSWIIIGILIIVTLGLLIQVGYAKKGGNPDQRGPNECKDGIDNDGDGLIDGTDPGCTGKGDKKETNSAIECDDAADNDGDGNIDSADAGCSSPTDTDETNCGDGVCEGGETGSICPADCGVPDSCTDSDGGIYQYVAGNVTGYQGGELFVYFDNCIDSNTVQEFYCLFDAPENEPVFCGGNATDSCINGACY